MNAAKHQPLFTKGNSKVPYYILNFSTATDCPGQTSGMCKVADICYAKRPERPNFRPAVLAFRRRQEEFWKTADAFAALDLANELELSARRARLPKLKQRVLRFSEAGDFHSQRNVNTFYYLCDRLINEYGWTVYGYTSRVDLKFWGLLDIGVKMLLSRDCYIYNNQTTRFNVVDEPSGGRFVCPGDCHTCTFCLSDKARGKTIEVVKH